jgi:hypothetical protein
VWSHPPLKKHAFPSHRVSPSAIHIALPTPKLFQG